MSILSCIVLLASCAKPSLEDDIYTCLHEYRVVSGPVYDNEFFIQERCKNNPKYKWENYGSAYWNDKDTAIKVAKGLGFTPAEMKQVWP